jgi:hypothetical protein
MQQSRMVAAAPMPFESRVAAAGAGVTWWAEGFRMFRSRIGGWATIMVAYFVVSLLLGEVPRIGAIAEWILSPVFLGGIMLGCDAIHRGQPLRVSHLFDGFKGPHFVPLLRLALCNLALCVVGVIVGAVVLGAGVGMSGLMDITNLPGDPWQMWETLGFTYFLLIALALIFFAVIAMANWFAPALIVLNGAKAIAAMTESVRACMRNWLPFLVYGLIGIVILIVAIAVFAGLAGLIGFETVIAFFDGNGSLGTFTFVTGLVAAAYLLLAAILAAMTFASTYASYRDILAANAAAPVGPA